MGQKLGSGHCFRVDVVLVQEPRQRFVGVQHVTVLVLSKELTGLQRVQNVKAFGGIQKARAQHRDLSFEHFRQFGNVDPPIGLNRHEVIGMVKAILSLVGLDGMFQVFQCHIHKRREVRQFHGGFVARKILTVNFLTVVARRNAQSVENGTSLVIGDAPCRQGLVFHERRIHAIEASEQLIRYQDFLVVCGGQNILEINQETSEVIERYHGHAVPDQGIVGVVPLGALCIHPNPPFRNEIRNLGEHGRHDFLDEIHFVDEHVGFTKKRPIAPDLVFFERNLLFPIVIEINRVLGVFQQRVVGLDSVRNIGVYK